MNGDTSILDEQIRDDLEPDVKEAIRRVIGSRIRHEILTLRSYMRNHYHPLLSYMFDSYDADDDFNEFKKEDNLKEILK